MAPCKGFDNSLLFVPIFLRRSSVCALVTGWLAKIGPLRLLCWWFQHAKVAENGLKLHRIQKVDGRMPE